MEMPTVSVIIPAYNCAKYISQAIDSALGQDIPVEVIVINDCTEDMLDTVMEAYKNNPSVRYIANEKNMGAAETRNKGVSLARGKYVAFLDGDDYWEAGKLKKQIVEMERSHAVLCCTARELITAEGKSTGRIIPVKTEITYQDLLKHNSINCSSVLLKTEVAKEFPMQHEDSHEDYIMWLRILQEYKSVCGINEPLLKYRLGTTGKSGTKWKSARMTFKVYRYMGFGMMKSIYCFCSYAWHGIWKYFFGKKVHEIRSGI